jgi:hypothetical protein
MAVIDAQRYGWTGVVFFSFEASMPEAPSFVVGDSVVDELEQDFESVRMFHPFHFSSLNSV